MCAYGMGVCRDLFLNCSSLFLSSLVSRQIVRQEVSTSSGIMAHLSRSPLPRFTLPPPLFCPPVLLAIAESLLQISGFGKSDRERAALLLYGDKNGGVTGRGVRSDGVRLKQDISMT